jgi:hypothetical protein
MKTWFIFLILFETLFLDYDVFLFLKNIRLIKKTFFVQKINKEMKLLPQEIKINKKDIY